MSEQQPCVLIVEDDDAFRGALMAALEKEGYLSASAKTLASARAKLAEAAFDAVLLDLRLSDGWGDVLLRELSERPSAPSVVVISAAVNVSEIAGHYGVMSIAKPFDFDIIAAAVKVALVQQFRPRAGLVPGDAPTPRFRS